MKLIFFLLIAIGVHAMEPGPFEDVLYKDPKTHFTVNSTEQKHEPKPIDEKTEILDSHGKSLWSMKYFVGRYHIDLSPDGKILALSGNYDFGYQLSLYPSTEVAVVFEQGKQIKKIILSDLFSEDPEKLADKRGLMVKGGGWVGLDEFITKITFDFKNKTASFELYDKTTKNIKF